MADALSTQPRHGRNFICAQNVSAGAPAAKEFLLKLNKAADL